MTIGQLMAPCVLALLRWRPQAKNQASGGSHVGSGPGWSTSRGKQDLSIQLIAISRSVVRRHRSSLESWHRSPGGGIVSLGHGGQKVFGFEPSRVAPSATVRCLPSSCSMPRRGTGGAGDDGGQGCGPQQ